MEQRVIESLLNAVLKMPEPLPRIILGELEACCPELASGIYHIQQLKVPFLRLNEARRTTLTGERHSGPRFSAVLITAETDEGQLICWPQFMLDKLPAHDLKLLLLSLEEWAGVVRRQIAQAPRIAAEKEQAKKESKLRKSMEDSL